MEPCFRLWPQDGHRIGGCSEARSTCNLPTPAQCERSSHDAAEGNDREWRNSRAGPAGYPATSRPRCQKCCTGHMHLFFCSLRPVPGNVSAADYALVAVWAAEAGQPARWGPLGEEVALAHALDWALAGCRDWPRGLFFTASPPQPTHVGPEGSRRLQLDIRLRESHTSRPFHSGQGGTFDLRGSGFGVGGALTQALNVPGA